ncbi:MAG: IS110 family transposase [Solirubrobacterales bacterium]
MDERRVIGLDLGIASAHTAVVLRADGTEVCRRRCWPTVESFAELESAALEGAPEGARLEIVVEPTGPAWLPVAVHFGRRGHSVYRVPSAKAADLRRFLSRHAKSNSIDAATLARLALVDPKGLRPVELPGADRASLDRRVRAADRLTRAAAQHKRRIKDLVRMLMPASPLTGDLTRSDLAVLERYADPNVLLRAGKARIAAVIAKASHNHKGIERAEQWLAAARASLALYAGDAAVAFADLAAEVATEVRLLRATETELALHSEVREQVYRRVDPEGLARSLPGIAEVGGPVLQAAIGRAHRFGSGSQFKSFTGLTPKASETGEVDRKGQPMSKAGSSLLRTQLLRSADIARTIDPQLAAIYYAQMVERGANHLKALCVVASHLAERAWAVLARGTPYELRNTDGRPVSRSEAKAIIAECWSVPEEVRRRRRSKKVGKVPHKVLSGHSSQRSRRDNEAAFPARIVGPRRARVNDAGGRLLTTDRH